MKNLRLILLVLYVILFWQNAHSQLNIPLQQPYNRPPWNYNGTESIADSVKASPNLVDWVLLELRGAFDSNIVYRSAVLALIDGRVISHTLKDTIRFDNINGYYYLVLYHRNRLPLISVNKRHFINSYLSSDFYFNNPMQVYGGKNALYLNESGVYVMIPGDTDNNSVVNVLDYKEISDNLFKVGYEDGDADMNGVVNVLDYQQVEKHLFKTSYVVPAK